MTKRESSSPATRLAINTVGEHYVLPRRPHIYILLVVASLEVHSRIEKGPLVDGEMTSTGHCRLQIFSKLSHI